MAGAAATSATAWLADFNFTPHRFTPGYEHRLSTSALVAGALLLVMVRISGKRTVGQFMPFKLPVAKRIFATFLVAGHA